MVNWNLSFDEGNTERDINAHDQAMLSWNNKYIMENFLIYNWMNKWPYIYIKNKNRFKKMKFENM